MSECGRCWSIAALKSRDAGQMIRARPIRLCAVEKTFVVSQTSLFFFSLSGNCTNPVVVVVVVVLVLRRAGDDDDSDDAGAV